MFGGGNVEDVFGDFWSFNMEEKKWNSLKQEDSIGWPEVILFLFSVVKEVLWCFMRSLILCSCLEGLKK